MLARALLPTVMIVGPWIVVISRAVVSDVHSSDKKPVSTCELDKFQALIIPRPGNPERLQNPLAWPSLRVEPLYLIFKHAFAGEDFESVSRRFVSSGCDGSIGRFDVAIIRLRCRCCAIEALPPHQAGDAGRLLAEQEQRDGRRELQSQRAARFAPSRRSSTFVDRIYHAS